ncbi:MAG: hypothetical protein ACLPOA_13000 [Methylocella sp.]|jgi:hypothetical protein
MLFLPFDALVGAILIENLQIYLEVGVPEGLSCLQLQEERTDRGVVLDFTIAVPQERPVIRSAAG